MSRYLGLFFDEAQAHVGSALELAPRLADAEAPSVVREVFRHAHSLKGLAATMDFRSMSSLAHAAEDLLDAIRQHEVSPAPAIIEVLQDTFASIQRMLEAAQRGANPEDAGASVVLERLTAVVQGTQAPPSPRLLEKPRSRAGGPVDRTRAKLWRIDLTLRELGSLEGVSRLFRDLAFVGTLRHTSTPSAPSGKGATVGRIRVLLAARCDAAEIETLLKRAPEVRSYAVRVERSSTERLPDTRSRPTWIRVRADLLDRALDDALELMLEAQRVAAAASAADHAPPTERGRLLLRDLYAKLMELRLVPFDSVAPRLTRAVHELARELGKPVRLEIEGRDVRLDRSMLEALFDPLTHLARNALDHGIEPQDRRRELGKPVEGRLRLRLSRRGDRVEIAMEDDGKGIHPDELREAAVRKGLITQRNADRLDDESARMLITLPGLSTRSEAGTVSGRGVGMDVVRAQVDLLGGKLGVASAPGSGTRVELILPLSQAVVPALLFRSCGELYAVPLERVERTLDLSDTRSRTTPEEVRAVRPRLPMTRIEGALSGPVDPPDDGTVLVLSTAEGARSLVVDEVLGRRELFVRPLDAALRGHPGFEGTALLDDGSVILVVDPEGLPADPEVRVY